MEPASWEGGWSREQLGTLGVSAMSAESCEGDLTTATGEERGLNLWCAWR